MQGKPLVHGSLFVKPGLSFNFVLHNQNKFNYITPLMDDDVLNHTMIGFHQCSGQYNGIDCGLFCIAVFLYLLDDKPVTEDTFNFNHCILLRSKLAAHFNRDIGANEQTSQIVRDCFPQLKVKASLAGSYGVEVVATVPVPSKPSIEDTKNDDDVILLGREDVEIDDKTTNEAKMPSILPERNIASNDKATSNNYDNSTNGDSKPSACPKGNVASAAMNDSQGRIFSLTASNEDTVFKDTLCPLNIVDFSTLDDVSPEA
jgi:hypothetical protein